MASAHPKLGLVLPEAWFDRDAPVVGPELLNKILVSHCDGEDVVAGRIVEVEAYTQADPASHTYSGRTPRNDVMFGPPARLYVYLSYGIHYCANVVTGNTGAGQALLLRAVVPLEGVETMRLRRIGRPDNELTNGPGKLCEAFGIGMEHYGTNLAEPSSSVTIVHDGTDPPAAPLIGPRVGISQAVDIPWRFRVPPASS